MSDTLKTKAEILEHILPRGAATPARWLLGVFGGVEMIESWLRADLEKEIDAIKKVLDMQQDFNEKSTKALSDAVDKIAAEFKKVEQVINYHAKQIEAAERVLKIVVKVLGIGTGGPPIVGEH